jgi:O-acetyl-ADP-ribose deacetylase
MGQIEILRGDITGQQVDAIVNAANSALLGGGGVDGAIHRRAGPELAEECRGLGGCRTGEAKLTGGHRLPARHVIHTVGPVWQGGGHDEEALLARCYQSVFALVARQGLRTIALPSISTGRYRFPIERAARIALREAAHACAENQALESVAFVCFEPAVHEAYRVAAAELGIQVGVDETG